MLEVQVRFLSLGLPVLAFGLLSCGTRQPRSNPIGEAYVGPAVLKIRRDIPVESPVVASVKHGERVELLQRRRRFFRVRVSSGVEGWTDERQLLAKEDMDKLKELGARAARMPLQGQATAFGALNVHTQPSRQSPGFLQIRENEKIDVLEHVVIPRTELPPKPLIPPAPKKAPVKKAPKEPKYPPLAPLPPPPGPPPNLVELSRTDLDADEADSTDADKDDEKEQKPLPMDDWSLVRTKDGEAGWVLTRRLVMAIPDDVAQYAEGHRIVSYFPLGEVQDGDQKKEDWLWTTIGGGTHWYDFDSFRVFIWSLRRHRYETAYIERNLQGYAPVLLKTVELSNPKGTSSAKYPGFSICFEKSDGQRYRREYAFLSNIVRFAGEGPCEAPPTETVSAQAALPAQPAGGPSSSSRSARLIRRIRERVRKWFGG
jgi:hypothetical protein